MLFKSAYLGDSEIVKAYKGDTLFYKAGLPSGYTRVNYLKNTTRGTSGAWIETGISFNNIKSFKINSFTITNFITTYDSWFGALYDLFNRCYFERNNNNNTIIMNSNNRYTLSFNTNETVDIAVKFGDKITLTKNGVDYNTSITNLTAFPQHFVLFGVENGRSGTDISQAGGACQIGESILYSANEIELWHGIPALDKNNRPCMFDMVSRQTFYSAGTGEFLYG